MTMNDDDKLIFTDDSSPAENSAKGSEDSWKVLIVDDDVWEYIALQNLF